MKMMAWPCSIAGSFALILGSFLAVPRAAQAQPCALTIPSGAVTLSNATFSFCSLSVSAGATLVIGGAVTLNMTGDVDIEGLVTGAGLGYGSFYNTSTGPGAGAMATTASGGGGGGHGGEGGNGVVSCWTGTITFPGGCSTLTGPVPGGLAYDSLFNPSWMGSAGGGVGGFSIGGKGGAAFILSAPSNNVTLNGIIDMSGMGLTIITNPQSGAGAGGTVSIDALGVFGSGTILANGGSVGNSSLSSGVGSGGAGGRVRICASGGPPSGFTGPVSVSGGSGGLGYTLCGLTCTNYKGQAGEDGSYYNCGPTATFTPTLTDTPTVTPTPSSTSTLTDTPSMTPTVTLTVTPTPTSTPTPLPCPPGYMGPQPPGLGESFTYPAPAVGNQVHFVYFLKEAGRAEVLVRNEKADLVADLSQDQGCGVQQVTLDLGRFAAGIYFYQVKFRYASGSGENLKIKKFMVLR